MLDHKAPVPTSDPALVCNDDESDDLLAFSPRKSRVKQLHGPHGCYECYLQLLPCDVAPNFDGKTCIMRP